MKARARGPGAVLVGLRRCGKSSVGPLLAKALDLPFLDLDREVARHSGATPGAILRTQGEKRLRTLELEALRGLPDLAALVLATGGGTPLIPGALPLLRRIGPVLYLSCSPEVLCRRAARDQDVLERPLLAGRTVEQETRLLWASRHVRYREASDAVINADGPPSAVLAACMTALSPACD